MPEPDHPLGTRTERSAETREALRRYAQAAPRFGVAGTCLGIATAFRLIGTGSTQNVGIVGTSLLMAGGATILMAFLAMTRLFVYEHSRSR